MIHILEGSSTTTLSNYLKALGIFRILAEQKDPDIKACWTNDKMTLHTNLSKDEIKEFILKQYNPTPIIAPWSYNKYKKTIKNLDNLIKDERFQPYKKTVSKMECVEKEFCNICKIDKITKDDIDKKTKHLLLRLCRNILPDDAVDWLDSVFVLTNETQKFSPILGTGANDSNFDMAENFVKKLNQLFKEQPEMSTKWLESALFGGVTELDKATMIGHNPDGTGGPNSGMGFLGKPLSNPWEYVMMMEGVILFGGNIARRQSGNIDKAIFPFMVSSSKIGYATASYDEDKDEKIDMGEIWVPLWRIPVTYKEIRHIFNEGRVEINGKQAKTGVEFARAIASFGTERGIPEFQRYCILKRKGDMYLTISAGRVQVADEPTIHLISDIDEWYNHVINLSKKKNVTASLKHLVRNMDTAIIKFCKSRKKLHMQEFLILIGNMERYISDHDNGMKPLQSLSKDWLVECYDGTAEFRLAASVASIKSVNSIGSIRENLENVELDKYNKWVQKKDSTSCVWREYDDLLRNMSHVLLRRGIDAKIKSADTIPINSTVPARISDIAEFLEGNLDMKKIGDLIPGLSLVDTSSSEYPWKNIREETMVPLPEAYIIMKMIHPPDRNDGIAFEMSVLNLLSAERIDDAYTRSSHILHAHGLPPLRYSKKTGTVQSTTLSDLARKRIMAALLFTVSEQDRKTLSEQAIMQFTNN